jgi:methyl-accepting chemotaxis protein
MNMEGMRQRMEPGPSAMLQHIRRVLGRGRSSFGLYSCRRRILVHRRYQIRAALTGVTGMGFVMALTVLLLSRSAGQDSRALLPAAPLLAGSLEESHRTDIFALIAGGLLIVAAVFLAGVFESRRTAGPVVNLRRRLDEVRAGRLGARVLLRRHDHFPELAEAFNGMAAALRARAEGDLATLARISDQMSDLLREEAVGNRQGVRRIAESVRQSLAEARLRRTDLLEP